MAKEKQPGKPTGRQITDETAKVYHFVPFASKVGRESIGGHHRLTSYCGKFECVITALTPLHVADGLIVAAGDLSHYGDIGNLDQATDPLIISHYRTWAPKAGRLVRAIPASSLKGAVRSVVEAVTDSCICCGPVDNKKRIQVGSLTDKCEVKSKERARGEDKKLCPACRIFGTLGFEGHARFSDALQQSGSGRIAHRPVPNSPNREGTFQEKYYEKVAAAGGKEVWRLRGRKFYHHFQPLQDQAAGLSYEPVEVCDEDSTFSFRVAFENLTANELGALLVGLAQHSELTHLSLGASKPFGYGAVTVQITGGEVLDADHGLKKLCLEFDGGVDSFDWQQVGKEAMDSTCKPKTGLVDLQRVRDLAAIWNPSDTEAAHGSDVVELWKQGRERLKPHP